ncbi:hypothetical protein HI914_06494 [Erysiphe necator]|nr:hypothetical protein HI914_06494 [Erysiphe necator]
MTDSKNTTGPSAFNKTNDPSLLKIDLALATAEDLKTFCENKSQLYKNDEVFDDELHYLYQYDFKGWDTTHFEQCGLRQAQKLRKLLRQNGVYMEKSKAQGVFKDIANALSLEYEPWSKLQISNALQEDSAFAFTSPNITCLINADPELYKIAYFNRQKKITNLPPPPNINDAYIKPE